MISGPSGTGSDRRLKTPCAFNRRLQPRCFDSSVRGRVGLMSKIEKPQAIERIDEIIELSDALMVARGDLGVEMPLESVPGLQKQLTRACRRAGKPVVVATQMLESMISSPVPTRAEVSDVATADDDADFDPHGPGLRDVGSDSIGNGNIDAKSLASHQRFAGGFEKNALVDWLCRHRHS